MLKALTNESSSRLSYRAQAWTGGLGPTESTLGTLLHKRGRAPLGLFRHAHRDGLVCLALALLVLVAVLISPIQRASASGSRRVPEGLRRNFGLPTSDSSRLSVSAWIMHEDAAVTVRSEDDDEDDDEPCGATRRAYDTDDPSLSPSRVASARNLAAPARVSALHPLRC